MFLTRAGNLSAKKGGDFMNTELSYAEKRWVIAEATRLRQVALDYLATPNEGYCFHGVYVGGCGIDWMCGYCESGDEGSSAYDYLEGVYRYKEAASTLRGIRRRAKGLEFEGRIKAAKQAKDYDLAGSLYEEALALRLPVRF